MKVELIRATERDHGTLANLLHLHVHDFSEFLGLTPSEEGRFTYPMLPLYWQDASRSAFLIRAGDRLVGLALVVRGSLVSGDPDVWDVAEFFVVRGVRRRGVGRAAAQQLFRMLNGFWEVRVLDVNTPARQFWQTVIAGYSAGSFTLEPWQRADGSAWHVFRFVSSGAS
jgi:predicted acetyltransferase